MADILQQEIEDIEGIFLAGEEEDDGKEALVEFCICSIPSLEDIVQCSNENCSILWYHKQCVGVTSDKSPNSGVAFDEWLCAECRSKEQQTTDGSAASAATKAIPVQSNQKAKMVYPAPTLLKENARQSAHQNLKDGLNSIFTDELFSIETPFVRGVKTLCKSVLASDHLEELATYLFDQLWDVVEVLRGKSWTEDRKTKMWSAFHSKCCCPDIREKWSGILDTVVANREEDLEIFLLQHVLEFCHDRMLMRLMDTDKPPMATPAKPEMMDKHEEQALRYAVGYVPFKLMKKFKKMERNESASKCVQVLEQWADGNGLDQKDDFISYTKEWLNCQNRGKLFQVNDNVYHFFRSLEYVSRSYIQVNNIINIRSSNVISTLMQKFKANANVINCWNKVVGEELDASLSSVLLEETLKCFAKMRTQAFIKAYLMIRKEYDHSVSRKAQKGLRKELSASQVPST